MNGDRPTVGKSDFCKTIGDYFRRAAEAEKDLSKEK
jgi:hypothetical protein